MRDVCPLSPAADKAAQMRWAAICQEQTSHTDNVGRLMETTLRRSPLRYASDWRQDIDTAPAALRMASSTTRARVLRLLHALRESDGLPDAGAQFVDRLLIVLVLGWRPP